VSNYPDGAANDPRAPWNQPDPEDQEPRWFHFEKDCRISVKASSQEEALERIAALHPPQDQTIELDFDPDNFEEDMP